MAVNGEPVNSKLTINVNKKAHLLTGISKWDNPNKIINKGGEH